jgi:flagellar biosynthesis component FlhA
MDMNKFGERIAIYRQNKNMTQDEFSSRLGVTAQAVSKWERGQSLPDISLINGICSILDADANEILNITPKSHITENDDIIVQKKLLSYLCAEPVKIIFGKDIIPVFVEGLKTKYISDKRLHIAGEEGILIPIMRITDDINLKDKEYRIISYDRVLYKEELKVIDETTFVFMIDKLFQICVENYAFILNKQIVKTLIDNVKTTYPGVANDIIPEKISYLFVQKVLQGILRKNGNIHNLITIIEIIEEETLIKNNNDVYAIVNEILRVFKTVS